VLCVDKLLSRLSCFFFVFCLFYVPSILCLRIMCILVITSICIVFLCDLSFVICSEYDACKLCLFYVPWIVCMYDVYSCYPSICMVFVCDLSFVICSEYDACKLCVFYVPWIVCMMCILVIHQWTWYLFVICLM